MNELDTKQVRLPWSAKWALRQSLGTTRGGAVIDFIESPRFPTLYYAVLLLAKGDWPGFLVHLPDDLRQSIVDDVRRKVTGGL